MRWRLHGLHWAADNVQVPSLEASELDGEQRFVVAEVGPKRWTWVDAVSQAAQSSGKKRN